MLNVSLRTRLILSYLLVLALGLGAFTVWVGVRMQNSIVEQREHELETEAFLIGLSIAEDVTELGDEAGDEAEAGESGEDDVGPADSTVRHRLQVFRDLAEQEGQRVIAIYGPSGRPLIASDATPTRLPREVAVALAGTEHHDIRYNPAADARYLFVAVPVYHEQRLVGAVQLGEPYERIRSEIARTWSLLFLSAGALVLIGVGVAVWLARSIVAPVRVLTDTAEEIAEGNLSRRTELETGDELGRLAGAFDCMADRLTALLEQQRQFVADASHELRTPLTAIGLRAEALRDGAREDETVAERYLHEIETEVQRMKHVIEDLLALSRFEAGLDRPQPEDVLLQKIVDRALSGIRPMAEEKGVQLKQELLPTELPIHVDAAKMERALVNLLSNAVKYSPAGGTVTVGAQYPAPEAPEALHLWVRDTGPGVPAEHLPHLFERFYRVDTARDRAAGGTGLGLAIVKAIVEAHDGRVWAKSTVGQGTTFHVLLPK